MLVITECPVFIPLVEKHSGLLPSLREALEKSEVFCSVREGVCLLFGVGDSLGDSVVSVLWGGRVSFGEKQLLAGLNFWASNQGKAFTWDIFWSYFATVAFDSTFFWFRNCREFWMSLKKIRNPENLKKGAQENCLVSVSESIETLEGAAVGSALGRGYRLDRLSGGE